MKGKNCLFAVAVCLTSLSTVFSAPSFLSVEKKETIISEQNIPEGLRQCYYRIKNGFTQESAKWRSGMIEHRNIVEVLPNTVSFHFDEVVMLTTQYTSVTGLESVTFSTGEGFSNTRCVTTSYQVTLTGETALQNGIDFLGVSLSSSRALQGSFSFNSSVSYSSSYSQDRSFSATYNVSNMPYVQPNGQIAGCIVADYFEATARIKEEEYWFWGTYETIGWRTFTFRQYTFMYDSYCFGNGAFGSATGRNY